MPELRSGYERRKEMLIIGLLIGAVIGATLGVLFHVFMAAADEEDEE